MFVEICYRCSKRAVAKGRLECRRLESVVLLPR